MKVGIDAHSVGMGAGGNETHYENLIRWLPRVDPHHQYLFYFSHLDRARIAPYEAGARVRGVALPWRNSALRVALALPHAIRRDRLDVFHAQYVLPPATRCRALVTIADLAYEHYPEHFPPLQRLRCKLLIPAAARQADHILTVSEFSKRDISVRYGISPDKITVTYHGADKIFVPQDREQAREAIQRKYGLAGRFLLYVGRVQARKNLERAVEALARLRERGSPQRLVIVGKKDFGAERLMAKVTQLSLENDVVFTGYVPTDDLPHFYGAADAFLFPSLFEGFGLPVVEAMACGVPVITSRGSSLEEVAGDAALLVDPLSVGEIEAAIERMVSDATLRADLSAKGLARSAQFSYESAARIVVGVYERLAGSMLS